MTGHPGGPRETEIFGPLLVLTDVELGVLERAHLRDLAHGASRGADAPAAAPCVQRELEPVVPVEDDDPRAAEAERSLRARGVVAVDGSLTSLTAAGALAQLLLDVRLGARAVVVVERLLGAPAPVDEDGPTPTPGGAHQRDLRLLHLVPEGGVVEDLHPEGLHGLDLVVDLAGLVQAVTQVLLPVDAVPGDPHVEIPPVDPASPELLADLLGRPTVLAELTLLVPPDEGDARADGQHDGAGGADGHPQPEGHLVALGPGGCHAAPRPAPGELLRFAPVDPGWVHDLVARWVGGVLVQEGDG